MLWAAGRQCCQEHTAGESQKRKKNIVGDWLPMLRERKTGEKQKKKKSTLSDCINSNAAREKTRQEAKRKKTTGERTKVRSRRGRRVLLATGCQCF